MPRLRTTLIQVAVTALVLSACGGGGGDGGGGEQSAATVTSTATSTANTSNVATTDTSTVATTDASPGRQRDRPRIERPSGTPLGTVFPPGDPAYQLLATGQCEELLRLIGRWRGRDDGNDVNEDAFFLYRAAAHACLGRWAEAQRDFDRLQALRPRFDGDCSSSNCERCMRAVLDWLRPLLDARRREPSIEPVFVRGTGRSPCPEAKETTTTGDDTSTSSRSSTTARATTSTR